MTQGFTKDDIGNQINLSPNKSSLADADKIGVWDTVGLRLVYQTYLQLKTQLGTGLSTEEVQDIVGGMVSGGIESGISVSYDDTGGKLDFIVNISDQIREKLTSNRTYYVRTDGNDSNTGLANSAGGAFLTIQKAIDVAASLDMSIYDVTIQVGAGTYSVSTSILLKQCHGAGAVTIIGDETTPSNVVVSLTGSMSFSGGCFYASATSTLYAIKGFQFKTTQTGNYAINANRGASINFQNCDFNAGTQNFQGHLRGDYGGTVFATGNYTISAGCGFHMIAVNGGAVRAVSITVTVSGTPAWGAAMAFAIILGAIVYDTVTFSGSATGPRYYADTNAVVYTNAGGANYFPGNVAGSTATGGQYA